MGSCDAGVWCAGSFETLMGFFSSGLGIGSVLNPVGMLSTLGQSGVELYNSAKDRSAARDANQQNINSAREQMAFQERMSSTAHQREVTDLAAAGINPVMSANSGASTPAGTMASVNPLPSRLRDLSLPSSALSMASSLSDLRLKNAQARGLEADASAKEAELPSKKKLSEGKSSLLDVLNFLPRLWRGMSSTSAREGFMRDANRVRDWFDPRKMRNQTIRDTERKPNTFIGSD